MWAGTDSSSLVRFLVGVVVAVAVPGIACFGYYRVDEISKINGIWTTLVILAYPAALIGLIMLLTTYFSAQPTKNRIVISTFCLIIPLLFLFLMEVFY